MKQVIDAKMDKIDKKWGRSLRNWPRFPPVDVEHSPTKKDQRQERQETSSAPSPMGATHPVNHEYLVQAVSLAMYDESVSHEFQSSSFCWPCRTSSMQRINEQDKSLFYCIEELL